MTTTTLLSGHEMPFVGLGTWKLDKDKASDAVYHAIQVGYRLIDCAAVYGNEKEVGQGLKRAFEEGLVRREELFVTSKLWNTDHAKHNVGPAAERTLRDLGLDYLDLYLIHFPISLKYVDPEVRYPVAWDHDTENPGIVLEDSPLRGTWEAMEELAASGKARTIGVSNFNVQNLLDLHCYAKIKPAVLQIEHHPLLQQAKLVEFCHRNNITITGFSSFGGVSYLQWDPNAENLLESDVIKAIAQKHNTTTSQVLLRWAIQNKVAVIPKSTDEAHLRQNIDVFGIALDEEDMKQVKALEKNFRFNDPGDMPTVRLPIYC